MSTTPPSMSRSERVRLTAERGPSVTKQCVIVFLGAVCAAVMAYSATRIAEPIWLLGLIPPLPLLFLGFLATTAWRMHSVVSARARTLVGPLEYLGVGTAVAGATLLVAGSTDLERLIGSVLIAVAGVLVLLILTGFATRARRRRSAVAQRDRNIQTAGIVVDNGLSDFPVTPNTKLATITVEFVDNTGVQRWLTPKAYQVPAKPIDVGDVVNVSFDPAEPGDISRIVVEFDNGVSRVIG